MLYILFQVLNLAVSFIILSLISKDKILLEDKVFSIILLFFIILFSILTEVHKPKLYQKKFKYVFAPHLKCVSLFFITALILNLFCASSTLQSEQNLNLIILTSVLFIFSNSIIIIYLLSSRRRKESPPEINKYAQESLVLDPTLKLGKLSTKVANKISNFPGAVLFEIDKILNHHYLSSVEIVKSSSELKDSVDLNDIIVLDVQLNMLVNINATLTEAYDRLKNGGLIILFYEEIEDYERRFVYSYISLLKAIRLIYYYLIKRVFPKIPLVGPISKLIGTKYNAISKAEMWGRLIYNGFEVIKNCDEQRLKYIIAQKSFSRSENPNPSFHPLIALNRVSLYGKIIKIHKLRSMYPYSEFIQKKVFEQNSLNRTGKFENDFRITKPGKLFRKYWLDELPQFYDWLRGEIKLVGIRAMSQHFFSLYPKDYKDLYLRVKPGIISPIFDEQTSGFEDIVCIEKSYLESYIKNSIMTDIKYFFITTKQIFTGIRSK